MKPLIHAIFIASLFIAPAHAQASNQSSVLRTSGFGQVMAKPDMATFSVAIESQAKTAKEAKTAVDGVVTTFLDALEKAGMERSDISSGHINIIPRYNYADGGKRDLIGYQGVRQITINVYELGKLNQYLDTALEAGINRIDQIELKVKDPQAYQQKARQLAIEDAKQKAKAVATGFDSQISGILSIDYQNKNYRPVMPKVAMAMEARSSADMSYQDTNLEITDTVDVEYRITTQSSD